MDVFQKCRTVPLGKQMVDAGFDAYYRVMQSPPDAEVVVDGRTMINLGSNNYLGLANDPRVKRAAREAVDAWGTGTTGARVLNGTLDLHADLERRFARFFRRDAAIFFTSGYLANLGVIAGLVGRGDVVVVDRRAHASIMDGARLSHGEVKRFRHNDVSDLRRILEGCGDAGKLVAIDGVYSMEGELAPLPRIVEVCREFGARLVLDDAHGLGVLGRDGRGTAEHFGLEDQVDVIVGTTSKALPAVGGFAVMERDVADFLRYSGTCRAFLFAASPPAAAVAAVREALTILEQEPALRRRLGDLTRRVHHAVGQLGFETMGSATPIVSIVVGALERTFDFWRRLSEEGIFTNVVLPPAVPAGECIIRMALTAAHTDAHVDRALDALERIGTELGVIGAEADAAELKTA